MNTPIVCELKGLLGGTVVRRPSKMIKSPYVADVILDECVAGASLGHEENATVLAHSASLGCNGLANAGAFVYMLPTAGNKCEYRICLSVCGVVVVGIYPKLAEVIVENALVGNCLGSCALDNILYYKRECVVKMDGHVDSRFDFGGVDRWGHEFLLEVKTVPLAMEVGCVGQKWGYFPDGYRKKHIQELEWLAVNTGKRCILCYVVQREDVGGFMTFSGDPEYKEAVKKAKLAGVEVIALRIKWNLNVLENGRVDATALLDGDLLQVSL